MQQKRILLTEVLDCKPGCEDGSGAFSVILERDHESKSGAISYSSRSTKGLFS